MTVPEVAKTLRVSRMTVKRMVADGRLVPVTPANPALKRQHYRFRRADVERLQAPAVAEDAPPYDPHA